jgi:hypothetical protein
MWNGGLQKKVSSRQNLKRILTVGEECVWTESAEELCKAMTMTMMREQ